MGELQTMDRWQKMEDVSARARLLRQEFITTIPEISTQRAALITQSYAETIGFPYIMRRALALEKILNEADIYIAAQELIVGGLAEKPRAVPVFPEYDVDFILDELDTFDLRVADRFFVSEQSKRQLRDILPKWRGQTIKDHALRIFPESATQAMSDLVCILTALKSGVGHMIVDYPLVLERGLEGIIEEVETRQAQMTIDDPNYASKRDFCRAVVICLRAAITYAARFAELAQTQAQDESDPARRQELLEIARICRKVPAQPADNFWEALQSFWFVHMVLHLESNGHSVSLGRFDQYMLPYYQGLEEHFPGQGRAFGQELLECFWIKLSEINKVRDKVSSVAFGGYPMFQHLTLGGQNPDGESAVNDLSHACLEATASVGLIQPSLSVRWYYGSPEEFINHAVQVASYGSGMPAFFNDEVLIPNMLQAGYNLDEARNYAIVGCTETTVPGISEPWLTGGFINIPKILELTIFDGYDLVLQKQNPFTTGPAESFQSFDQFLEAYLRQVSYYLEQQVICDNVLDELHGQLLPTPFEAAFISDCLQQCRTSLEGGARYNNTTINAVGIANVADSLAVVKKLIYEDHSLTWEELKEALRDNFENHQVLRQRLLKEVPKYGNDEDYVDRLGNRVLDHLYRQVNTYHNARGGSYLIALYSIACHVLLADRVAALPDGRKFGTVLADGGVSCAQGRDEHGPTALLKSVSKLDPYKAVGSTLLNVKLHPNVFKNPDNIPKVASLIKTYFLMKGQHVQFNVVDAATLRDAQKHPDNYPFLVVRVAGFSVLFTTIEPLLQEDIILRTEHQSA